MPENSSNLKPLPKNRRLEAKEIKLVLTDRGDSIVGLARKWECSIWNLKAVIYRYAGSVCQHERELLADYLGCAVWQIGNEPARKDEPAEAAA